MADTATPEKKATSGTVNILGHPVKKTTALGLGVVGVGVVGVAMYRKKEANAAAAAAAASGTGTGTGAFTDPAGNQCAAPDAETGYCPGTPEDISAQEQLSAGSVASGLDTSVPDLSGGGSTVNSTVPVFTDNGSWGQYVEEALGSNGSDTIAAAIAKYLSGQSVTSAQQTIIEQAIAIANYPPVAGSGGFPPSINLSSAAPPSTGTTPPPPAGSAPAAPTGLSITGSSKTTWVVSWKPVSGATGYVFAISPAPKGGSSGSHNIGDRTSYDVGGIVTGTTYTVTVAAANSAGTGSAASKSLKAGA